jgi:large conductance mechanosensitive channel
MSKGTGLLKEFRDFIMRGNVVDLAVAVVLGAAFGAVVAAFVKNLLTPLIAAIFGEPDFSQLTFTVNGSVFRYGAFINAVITFVLVALAVYFLVVRPYNAYRERKKVEEPGEPTDEVKLLTEIRDLLSQ